MSKIIYKKYNPYKLFIGLFIPNSIAKSTKISSGAKICLGRLFQYAGKNGRCFPKQETLAIEMGKSVKQTRRYLDELESNKLIQRIKAEGIDKLNHKPDSYIFLWNKEFFEAEFDDDEDEPEDDKMSDSEGTFLVDSEGDADDPSLLNRISTNIESDITTNVVNINSQANLPDDDGNSKEPLPLGAKKQGHAESLRNTFRERRNKKTPLIGKQHTILKLNEPYWGIMLESGLRTPKNAGTKAYKETDELITQLRLGKYFDNIPGYEKFKGRVITVDDFKRFYKNFSLAVLSPDHAPQNTGIKNAWKNWYLSRILYNNSSANNKSLFITYLDNSPPLLQTKLKDPNPEYTDYVITACKKKFGWDLSNGSREIAIKCAIKLSNFFETNKHKILHYNMHYKFTNQQVAELLTMLERNESDEYPAKPLYLYSDLTYNKLLPEHLKYVGSIKENG